MLVSSNIVMWSGVFFPSQALIVILNQNGDRGEMRKRSLAFYCSL
jgi:hypothetical protein